MSKKNSAVSTLRILEASVIQETLGKIEKITPESVIILKGRPGSSSYNRMVIPRETIKFIQQGGAHKRFPDRLLYEGVREFTVDGIFDGLEKDGSIRLTTENGTIISRIGTVTEKETTKLEETSKTSKKADKDKKAEKKTGNKKAEKK